jgi:hypothetical protein
MLFHHDNRDYQQAASDAATRARALLEGKIEKGRARANNVISMVETEVPQDYIVPANRMRFEADENDLLLEFNDQNNEEVLSGLHNNAYQQACTLMGLPRRWADKKLAGEPWERKQLVDNFNLEMQHREARQLVRIVDGETRALLSNKYRRIDSRPAINAFAEVCQEFDAVPIEGYYMQTKLALKAVLPMVFEPVDNEVLSIGVCMQTSDYGDGAYVVAMFMLRLWCTNYAIATDLMRQRHLGKRLDDNMEYSAETYRLDTEATVSATRDMVREALKAESVNGLLDGIRKAHEEEVSATSVKAFLKKYLNTNEEREEVVRAFNSPDVQNLPPGQNKLRLSNAISWIAGQKDERRRLEMQQVAGLLIQEKEAA